MSPPIRTCGSTPTVRIRPILVRSSLSPCSARTRVLEDYLSRVQAAQREMSKAKVKAKVPRAAPPPSPAAAAGPAPGTLPFVEVGAVTDGEPGEEVTAVQRGSNGQIHEAPLARRPRLVPVGAAGRQRSDIGHVQPRPGAWVEGHAGAVGGERLPPVAAFSTDMVRHRAPALHPVPATAGRRKYRGCACAS